jgi:hypothetical protein
MKDATLEKLVEELAQKLKLVEPDEDTLTLLEDEIQDAEAEIVLELNLDGLPEDNHADVIELAALYYEHDTDQPTNPFSYKRVQDLLRKIRSKHYGKIV